jgi:hypothetical protein
MDTTNTQVMSLRLSSEEVQKIDAAAAAAGMSRADYTRSRLLSPNPAPAPEAGSKHFEDLLLHLIYIANRIHVAVYYIAETAGTLPTERLEELYDEVAEEGIRYLNDLPQHMAKVQAQMTAQANTAPSAAEKREA